MTPTEFTQKFPRLPGAMPVWHGEVDEVQFRSLCEQVKHDGGRLLALWGSDEQPRGNGYALHVALVNSAGMLCLTLSVAAAHPAYPDVSDLFPAASRMQRAVTDLLGLHPAGADDQRKWLRHASWPSDQHPLRKGFDAGTVHPTAADAYPFVTVTGDGVHEIPVGPVHAGTIEPGHFRFSIIGDRVLRLEQRLGYKHKGIEKRFESMNLEQGAKLAGRISGDSTVAYAWAYAQAVESLCGTTPSPRAISIRAVFLELERILNHLGDLGYLGNDVALAFGFAQFWILKEDLLRQNGELFGHRYLMDRIAPGGVACDIDAHGGDKLRGTLTHIEQVTAKLREIYDEHTGAQDRFLSTGKVAPELAAQLGLTGLPGRASGQAWDLRADFPCAPYDQLDVLMATHRNGDVAARVILRFEEIAESIRLIRDLLGKLPEGSLIEKIADAADGKLGIGWVEGWRGEIMVALHSGKNNSIHRLHPHDPSWQNWPVLEHAIIGNIVPDFPLINKSFNLSYSGQDL
ncbi:MAG TPA: NADH-quinone oxidoreductase subunit C [Gallionellaceae bacterium]|nr:NADH-quinone oxidoreductase subunit C [Gallionellaceae bacterium]